MLKATVTLAFLLLFGASSGALEYVTVDLNYNQDYDNYDRYGGGFASYFESSPVEVAQLTGVPLAVATQGQPGPHVLSTVDEGPETVVIDITDTTVHAVYLLGTGNWLGEAYGHDSLWCEDTAHLSFTLSYADASSTELFPIMVSNGFQRWGDVFYGDVGGYPGVQAGSFEFFPEGYYHLYLLPVDDNKILASVTLNDKTSGANFGDYTILAMTLKISSPIAVTNLDDSGIGSLRWALDSANTSPASDTITFAVSGTITPLTELPGITDDYTIIMGGTAPGGVRSVVIDGSSAGAANGLSVESSNNSIRNIVLTNWETTCLDIDGNYNDVVGCNIGVNAAGDTRASYGMGVQIYGNHNTIGDCPEGARNVLSGGVEANRAAFRIYGDSNKVVNAFVGMSTSGVILTDPPTSVHGISVYGNGNIIGDAGCPNYVGGNAFGIVTNIVARDNIIQSNVVGLAPNLVDTIPNSAGIWIASNHNIIGEDNIVVGNSHNGIYIRNDSNIIIGNTISGNGMSGILMEGGGSFNRFGGHLDSEKNTIASNGIYGIYIGMESDSNMIIGNTIGGTLSSPGEGNVDGGISIQKYSKWNLIDSNIIAYNRNGIEILDSSSYNTITRNEIYFNDYLGIDLDYDGVTLNDSEDVDYGANDLLNYPEPDSIHMSPDSSFTIYGKAAYNALVELFLAHPAGDSTLPADPSGHGEAYSYIGSAACDDSGVFIYTVPNTVPQFSLITATTTDVFGNTSEFSPNRTLIPGPLIIVAYWTASAVNMMVTDPEGYYIGKDSLSTLHQTLFPATYTENAANDSVHIPYPKLGTYTIEIYAERPEKLMVLEKGPKAASYDLGIRLDGSFETIIANDAVAPPSGAPPDDYSYDVEEGYHYHNGDADRSEGINLLDATFIINYLYKEGPEPYPVWAADADCDMFINILDVTFIINYLYKNGPEPCRPTE